MRESGNATIVCRLVRGGVIATVCLFGCAPRQVHLAADPQQGSAPDLRPELLWSDYDAVLHRCVRDGLVDYVALAADAGRLDTTLARLAKIGPNTTPSAFVAPASKTAYWINAANAAVLRSVLELARPTPADAGSKRLFNLRPLVDLLRACQFLVDGRWRTPADLRRQALEAGENDWRLMLVLCEGRRGGPPLWQEAFLFDAPGSQLDQASAAALELPQMVFIDHGFQRLRLSPLLCSLRPRLLAQSSRDASMPSPTMLDWLLSRANAARRRALNAAVGYPERRLAYDWRINQVDPPDESIMGF